MRWRLTAGMATGDILLQDATTSQKISLLSRIAEKQTRDNLEMQG